MTRTFTMRTLAALTVAGLLASGLVAAQKSDQADVLLQAALSKEIVEGDLKAAIEQYKRLAQNRDRAVAARALVRLAASYEKLGLDDAHHVYERVVREFADETATAATARTRLAALRSSAVAQVGQTSRLVWSDRRLSTGEPGPISADGRYMTFSDLSLTVVDLESGTTKTFSPASLGDEKGYVEGSAISPDGRQVAYVLANGEREEVRVLQIGGGEAKSRAIFMDPRHGSLYLFGWSPDGRTVLVTRAGQEDQTQEIIVVSIADGAVRVLQRLTGNCCSRAQFSDDGHFVAYSRSESGNPAGLFVSTLDGKEMRIDVGPGQNRDPIWSRDGAHILFETSRTGTWSLWMAPVAGGIPSGPARLIKENVGGMHSLGSTRNGALYYLAGNRITNVYTADLDDKLNASAAPSMATDRYINSNRAGVWSPDGEHLAYLSVTPRGIFIRVRSVKTGEDREIPSQIPISGPVRWFPDGRSLLVASRGARLLNGELGYYRVDVASGNAEVLHQTASREVVSTRPDLSPDGKTIFYLETRAQPVRFDIDSRRETRLTTLFNHAGRDQPITLAVSPDGAQVAYLAGSSVVVAPASGGEPRVVARFAGNWTARERDDGLGLAWSPDQRHLFFVRPEGDTGDGSKAVWRVPLAGGEAENIGISMNRIRALRVHPDGRRIAFDSVVDPRSEVWVLENFLPKSGSKR